jgi:hypothetical protein
MWRAAGRTQDQPPRRPVAGSRRAAASVAPAAGRSRAAIEEDLRGVHALRTGVSSGPIVAGGTFTEIIARRVDRLLDELLRLPTVPQGADAPHGHGRATTPGGTSPS